MDKTFGNEMMFDDDEGGYRFGYRGDYIVFLQFVPFHNAHDCAN